MIFTCAFVGMMIATFHGFIHGDPWKLIAPIDGDGRICGYPNDATGKEDMTGYSYLFIGDIGAVLAPGQEVSEQSLFDYGVCVKKCPTKKNPEVECVGTERVPDCNAAGLESYTTHKLLSYCIPSYDSLPDDLKPQFETAKDAAAHSLLGSTIVEIVEAKSFIIISIFVCLTVTVLYLIVMHYFTSIFTMI